MMILSIFIGYISQLHIMKNDLGIVPDIRYLSPLYIPAGILGIWVLRAIAGNEFISKRFLLKTTGAAVILLPGIFFYIYFMSQPSVNIFNIIAFFKIPICLEVLLLIAGLILFKLKRIQWVAVEYIPAAMLATVLVWQLMLLSLSIGKVNGYPFWIPVVDYAYHSIIQPHFS